MPKGERPVPAVVLIVDDDPSVRGVVRYMLEGEGFDVHEAVDGPTALKVLADESPGVVVLDLALPHQSGYEVLEARRRDKLAPSSRVLVLTGKTSPRDLDRALELGADDFLVKPFDPPVLVQRITELLAGAPPRYTEKDTKRLLEELYSAQDPVAEA